MESAPQPSNGNNEELKFHSLDSPPPIESGKKIPPKPGTLAFYLEERMRLNEEFRQAQSSKARDLILEEMEELDRKMDKDNRNERNMIYDDNNDEEVAA
jgi:hypothetical protein